jgi:hypothetical protein
VTQWVVRYRHLQRIAEREQRRQSARISRQSEVARVLWDSLDTRQQARWIALNALLDDER